MDEKPANPDSLLTLPVVMGVVVVVGGVAALLVSGLFVYRAHAVNAETERIQASLEADREPESSVVIEAEQKDAPPASAADTQPTRPLVVVNNVAASASSEAGESTLKPGVRLQAQRPAHWDQAEIIDILEGQKIKIRWLSGEPGEDVIAAELVRGDDPPTQ